MRRRAGYAAIAVVALALVYQLCFRYEYLASDRSTIVRVDRLTGAACLVWLGGYPIPKKLACKTFL